MPVIPEYDAKVPLDTSGGRGMPKVDLSTADLTAQAGLAKAVGGIGSAISEVAQHRDQRAVQTEDFTTQINLSRLQQQVAGDDQAALQNLPENGEGWHDARLKNFDEKFAPQFMAGVSDRLKPEFQQKLALMRDGLSNSYATTQRDQRNKFVDTETNQQIDAAKNTVDANPAALDAAKASLRDSINKSPRDDAWKAEKLRQLDAGLEEAAVRGIAKLDPKAAQTALGVGVSGAISGVVNKIIGVESGGDSKAQNPNSSAAGAGQFIDGTWLAMMKKYKPEITAGKSDADIIGLKGDGKLSREMTTHYAEENAGALRNAGIAATQGNIYLAHFLGPGGAIKVLSVDPSTPVASIVGNDAVAANKSILQGKTAGQVAEWAAGKMGSASGKAVEPPGDPGLRNIPYDRRQALAADFDRQGAATLAAQQTAIAADTSKKLNQLQNDIIDGKAGMAEIQAARQTWLTDADSANSVIAAVTKRDKGVADVNAFNAAIATPGFTWNHVDSAHKDMAEAGFKSLGSTMPALQSVVEKTGMVPASAGTVLQGAISSNDPTRVANAMTVANNLMARNPAIFSGVTGSKEIEQNAVAFKHYTELGLSPQQSAQRIIKEQSPEYQAAVRARIKSEDIDTIIKKQLDIGDLSKMFNEGVPVLGRPTVAFDPAVRQSMFSDYAEVFRDRYMETGDVGLAKAQAQKQLSAVWGTTHVQGQTFSGNLMRFPPEKAKAYEGIPDISTRIAGEAQRVIARETARLSGPYFGPANVLGRVEAGNINLNDRPIARNADGSISTVRSMSFEDKGKEVLIPTVSPDGKILSDQEAIALYDKTGQHLGKFNTPAQATAYAESLHKEQEKTYAASAIPREKIMIAVTGDGSTARAFWDEQAQSVPYTLSWTDKNGHLQTLNPGTPFAPDAAAMRAKISGEREAKMNSVSPDGVPTTPPREITADMTPVQKAEVNRQNAAREPATGFVTDALKAGVTMASSAGKNISSFFSNMSQQAGRDATEQRIASYTERKIKNTPELLAEFNAFETRMKAAKNQADEKAIASDIAKRYDEVRSVAMQDNALVKDLGPRHAKVRLPDRGGSQIANN